MIQKEHIFAIMKDFPAFSFIRKCALFQGINEREFNELFSNIDYKVQAFNKGEVVAWQGEENHRLLVLLNGYLVSEMNDFSGKSIQIASFQKPSIVAPGFLFGQNNKFPVQVSAQGESQVLILPKQSLLIFKN